jgi:hypothetical protein
VQRSVIAVLDQQGRRNRPSFPRRQSSPEIVMWRGIGRAALQITYGRSLVDDDRQTSLLFGYMVGLCLKVRSYWNAARRQRRVSAPRAGEGASWLATTRRPTTTNPKTRLTFSLHMSFA